MESHDVSPNDRPDHARSKQDYIRTPNRAPITKALVLKSHTLLKGSSMASTSLNISVVEKRMLKLSEASDYTGLPAKHFKIICPVQPLELRKGTTVWDKRDLDQWIDTMKEGTEFASQDAILGKL